MPVSEDVVSPSLATADQMQQATSAAAKRSGFAIQTRGLTKTFGEVTAVSDVTLAIRRGGVTGFVGPNGAGKTTLIRMLLGLIRPTTGSAVVLGKSISTPRKYLHRVGALIEAPAFYPTLSARRNLRILALAGAHDVARIEQVLEIVGLTNRAEDAFKSFSLGMKQRLGIAAALLPDPELLILDEPTNGLDPAGIQEIRGLLRRLADEGKTVFVSSHLMGEMQKICDDLVIIRRGKILFQGPVQSLIARSVGILVAARDPSHHAGLITLVHSAGYTARLQNGNVFVEAPPVWAAELNALAMDAGIVLRELHAQGGDLEDIVLGLTGRGTP